MEYLNKIKAGYTLKRSEIFFVIEELRTLDFGITIGTLGEYIFRAQYVYWPLGNLHGITSIGPLPDFAHPKFGLMAIFQTNAHSPELAIQQLAFTAINNLEHLQEAVKTHA